MFFTLPAEIRNITYDHTLHYPSCLDLYSVYYQRIYSTRSTSTSLGIAPALSHQRTLFHTPAILLVCRQITAECQPILKSRPFIIDRLPPFRLDDKAGGLMEISDFVGRSTLQNLRHIDIRIGLGEGPLGSGWVWKKVLDEMLEILTERNTCAKLRLLIRLCNPTAKGHGTVWDAEWDCHQYMMKVSLGACSVLLHLHSPYCQRMVC